MSNKVYDSLKWIAIVGIYGLCVLVSGLGRIWGLPHTTEIIETLNLIGTVLGIWLGVSSVKYYKSLSEFEDIEIVEEEEDE